MEFNDYFFVQFYLFPSKDMEFTIPANVSLESRMRSETMQCGLSSELRVERIFRNSGGALVPILGDNSVG